ncbi:MAG: Spy/CpxP family protein refolding chaperone [Proteobacteria bacterium]|nr:Spy/CpxP family protein refolding chaperone [Pseudomonadota bacterium]
MRKIIVTLALVLGCSSVAWGFFPGGPGPHGKGLGVEMLRTWFELDLSDAQKTQAASILKQYREEIIKKREAVRMAFEQAHQTRPAPDKFDESAVRKGHKLISAARVEIMVLREKILSELYAILTPEQQKILETRMWAVQKPGSGLGEGKPMGKPGPEDELPLLDAFIKAHG